MTTIDELRSNNESLRERLADAEATLGAIRQGEVESLIIQTPDGPRIFSLVDANTPYRTFVESMPLGTAAISRDGLVLYCNQSLPALLQAPIEHVMGSNWFDFIADESVASFREFLGRAEKSQVHLELNLTTENGKIVPVSILSTPRFIGGDGVACLIITDLTERRRSEESVRQLASIIDSTDDAVIGMTLGLNVLSWNQGAERLYGYGQNELIGKSVLKIVPEEFREVFVNQMKLVAIGQNVSHYETIRLCKDESKVDVSITLSPTRNMDGKVTGAAAIARDITQRKAFDKELSLAKESAELGTRTKSEFLANMSHEIRTPMNGIIGLTGLVLETKLTPEQRQCLDGVMTSSRSLLKIINSILDFSKIEAGQLDLEQVPYDLREIVEIAVSSLAQAAHEKGLELICEVDPNVPSRVLGDPARLSQVLINLVENAIKFTAHGEVSVRVEPEGELSSPWKLRFQVSDTGVGIKASKQSLLFHSFTQADSSTTRQYGGTGLGLVISERLVEMMGGRIWFDSIEGCGSQFYFTILCDVVPEQPALNPELDVSRLDGRRVLVVDDNATNRRFLSVRLDEWGMTSLAVESGTAALKSLSGAEVTHEPWDLILLDLTMPEMDGFSVLEQLQSMPDTLRKIILLVSSVDQTEDIARAHQLGVQSLLSKPICSGELLRVIQKKLGLPIRPTNSPTPILPVAPARLQGPPLRILVAEDNPLNQLLAVRTLQKAGHTVAIANNGEEAIEALGHEPFDLVLMDVQMPVMDGFQATARIRQREIISGQHQRIIAMTAHALKGDRERCLNAGMDDYVSKPIQNSELFAAIDNSRTGSGITLVPLPGET